MDMPLHPLLVHIPVMLLPLTVLLVLPTIVSRRWFDRVAPIAAIGAVIGAIGAFLAAATGEELLHQLGEHSAVVERHAELGDATEATALIFAILVLVQVGLFWDKSPAKLRAWGEKIPGGYTSVTGLTILVGIVALVIVVLTGHAGAESVWLG